MKYRRTALSVTAGLGLAASLGLGAMPAVASTPAPSPTVATSGSADTEQTRLGYTGEEQQANEAFFKAVMRDVVKKQAAEPGTQAVTVNYDASAAPTFGSQIANSTSVWNAAVSNVQLQEGGSASFEYREGNDPRGSYASTDGHGSGYIFLDYAQNEQYDSNRVTSHETGHVLGLPDNYEGPCEELMSGGGPGTSCTNDKPNAAESAEVEQLWANGLAEAVLEQTVFSK